MEPTLPELLSEPRTELQRKQRLLVYAFFRVPGQAQRQVSLLVSTG